MPVTFDIASGETNADLTGFTRGTANYALAGVQHADIANSEFVSYGSSSMGALDSRVDEPGGLFNRTNATFGLVSPPSGSQTIDFDDAASGLGNNVLIATFDGVNTTTPIRTTKINRVGSASAISVTFDVGESSADDLLVACVFSLGAPEGWTSNLSGTVRRQQSANGGSTNFCALVTAPGSASSQTWTLTTTTGSGDLLVFAYSLQPTSGGGGGQRPAPGLVVPANAWPDPWWG